jgi:hypothetical protein
MLETILQNQECKGCPSYIKKEKRCHFIKKYHDFAFLFEVCSCKNCLVKMVCKGDERSTCMLLKQSIKLSSERIKNGTPT